MDDQSPVSLVVRRATDRLDARAVAEAQPPAPATPSEPDFTSPERPTGAPA